MEKIKHISEIFLAFNHMTKEDWHRFLLLVSKYVGRFKKWELIVDINMNEVRYFIKSSKKFPPTIGDMTQFLLKESNEDIDLKYNYGLVYFSSIDSNIIDIYDKNEIKKMRKLKQVNFTFHLLKNDKYLSKTKFIFENIHNKSLVNKRVLFSNPSTLLNIKYENSRFFYKKKPKYLDIQKTIHLLKSELSSSILKVDAFPFLQGDYYLNQNAYNFDKHSIIIGGSGTGKSKLMSLFINNIISNPEYHLKYKIIVIDPHASLENDIGGLEGLKLMSFLNTDASADLFGSDSDDIVASVEMMLSLFKNLLAEQYNSKLERVLRYSSYLLLTKKDFSFINLRKVLLETEYRLNLVKELSSLLPDPVIDFFLNDFNELKTRSYMEAINPIVSFIDEVVLLPAFNNKETLTNINRVIKDNTITLLSLDKNKLGEKSIKTIVGLALGKIMELIQSQTLNEHVILMIDEVPVIESPIISRFLSEARKYGLSLFLAGQYFNQISKGLQDSIFANVSNYYVFRVSKLDATLLESNLSIKIVGDFNQEDRINMLSRLNDRECIVRINSNGLILPALKAKTMDYIPKPRKRVELKQVTDIVDIKPKEDSLKRPFSIESRITLNELMIEQSQSRKKVG